MAALRDGHSQSSRRQTCFEESFCAHSAVGVGVVALQLLSASSAFAYYVTISATAGCTDGVAVINYTAGSWDPFLPGSNTQVDILFDCHRRRFAAVRPAHELVLRIEPALHGATR